MCERFVSDELEALNSFEFLFSIVACALFPKQNESHTAMPVLTTLTATYEGAQFVKKGGGLKFCQHSPMKYSSIGTAGCSKPV